jgi:hypothetical protein
MGICDECLSSKVCIKCKPHSTLNEDFICQCDKGYDGDSECKRRSFEAVIKVDNHNKVILVFTEKLSRT